MGGGFFIALDGGLYGRVAAALLGLGGISTVDDGSGEVVQVADGAGRLFTLYESVPRGTEWEVHDGPFTAAPGVSLPDMRRVVACPFECRWADLVARLADRAARTSEVPTWVLDGDGVVWNADGVDPSAVRL